MLAGQLIHLVSVVERVEVPAGLIVERVVAEQESRLPLHGELDA